MQLFFVSWLRSAGSQHLGNHHAKLPYKLFVKQAALLINAIATGSPASLQLHQYSLVDDHLPVLLVDLSETVGDYTVHVYYM